MKFTLPWRVAHPAAVNRNIWPTPLQATLLRAAVAQGEAALQAWQEWSPIFEDGIDLPSYRLLPLVYRNLQRQGFQDALLGRLKGIYRKTWVENQFVYQQAAAVLRLLKTAGIQTMVLKGVGLGLRYYQDPGLRPMGDFDILVPIETRAAAIRTLLSAGWAFAQPDQSTPDYLDLRHSVNFRGPGGVEFDLHWHMLADCLGEDADREFWEGAIPLEVQAADTLAPCPTDMLLHICYHGMRWDVVAPLRWIPDALTILSVAGEEIDWGRLVGTARRLRIGLFLLTALVYLQQEYQAAIPPEVLDGLRAIPASHLERAEFFAITHRSYTFGRLPRYGFSYLRFRRDHPRQIGFLRYVQRVNGLGDYQELLDWGIKRSTQRLGRLVKGAPEHGSETVHAEKIFRRRVNE